jgi:hypothetical protein
MGARLAYVNHASATAPAANPPVDLPHPSARCTSESFPDLRAGLFRGEKGMSIELHGVARLQLTVDDFASHGRLSERLLAAGDDR